MIPQNARQTLITCSTGQLLKCRRMIVENTGRMPVNSGALAVMADFYKEYPQFRTGAKQTDRAYPWFGWPEQNGARISQIVLDHTAAIANKQETADEASAGMTADIKAQLP